MEEDTTYHTTTHSKVSLHPGPHITTPIVQTRVHSTLKEPISRHVAVEKPIEKEVIVEEVVEHNILCHNDPTYIHDVDVHECNCPAAVAAVAPIAFAELTEEERKYTGVFPWWLFPLILLGLLLIALLLFCTMRKAKKVEIKKPQRTFAIEKINKEQDEAEIEAEIEAQLQARRKASQLEANRDEEVREIVEEKQVYSNEAQNQTPGSNKRVVKKRIVKMMKQGELIAEKEEILDEEGNIIKTQMKKSNQS